MHALLFIFPYFFMIGILVGVLSVLFGIGGGLLIVPAVSLFLNLSHYPTSIAMKVAVATSLITIFFSTLNVLYKQSKSGYVLWGEIKRILPFIIIGGLSGIFIAHLASGDMVRWIFIGFLLIIIVRSLMSSNFKAQYTLEDYQRPTLISLGMVGILMGILNNLIGIGGNVLLLPYLRRCKMPMKNASAFTVATMPVLAIIGSSGYLVSGFHVAKLPSYSLGYINLPAFILILLGSFLGATIGNKIEHRISDTLQAKAYIGLLIVITVLMLLG